MAVTLRLAVDIRGVAADLKAAATGFERALADQLRAGAEGIAQAAKPRMRYRGTGAWKSSSGAQLPHIRDTYDARATLTGATVGSTHPAAVVWEFGGQIAPRVPGGSRVARATRPSALISIPRLAPVGQAGEALLPRIEQAVARRVDELLITHRL